MRSVPTTSIDLGSPALLADPYPAFAVERARAPIAWHEPTQRWLTFSYATVSAVQRSRSLGRVWTDREPADRLEPFNLLHRNQMMENEPPAHTRLRRPVAAAFNRGHVERLRPRVRQLATSLLDEVEPSSFDVIAAYAEPLPVLVIAELLGVPGSWAPRLREWSQAIVRMYEPDPSERVVGEAVRAATDFAELVRDLVELRRRVPRDDLISHLVADERSTLTEDEVVASVVLLLNAGHEASVNVFGNGLVAMLRRDLRPAADAALTVEELLRFDAALQLFERTATAVVPIGEVILAPGERVAALLGAGNRDPAVFTEPDAFHVARDPNPHLAFGVGVHFCLGAPLARLELLESLTALFARFPGLRLDNEPVSRGTFVLRGHREVRVRT